MKYLFSLLAILGLMSCATSQNAQYSMIEYQAGPCFGFCPIYKFTVSPDRKAVLEAEHFNFTEGGTKDDFNKPREGTFQTTLSKADYDQLVAMVDAADIKTLKDSYIDERIMDASKNNLRIKYANGTMKDIAMSAGEKPQKLTDLQKFITELKEKQSWKKVN